MADPPAKKCKSCGAAIHWVRLSSGKRMPVNADPSPYWCPCPGETMVVKVATKQAIVVKIPDDKPLVQLFVPHWATCPDAAKWRKKGGAND